MHKNYKVSLVLPCLNEEDGIRSTYKRIPRLVDEVIVVDGGSKDRTAQVARELGAKVIVEKRRGYGLAHKTGFQAALGDIIVAADGDSTYPVEVCADIIDYLIAGELDFVSTSRFPLRNSGAMRFRNFIGNNIITLLLNLLYKAKMTDGLSGMWVFRKSALKAMTLKSDNWNMSEEIKIEAITRPGIKFAEYPIVYAERLGDTKLIPWTVGIQNILFLFYKRFFAG